VTATAASVVTPNVARAKECPAAGMDWMNMSLEARNLAYNNGSMSDLTTLGRKPKAGLQLRKHCASSVQNTSICLMLQESGRSGTSIPPTILRHRASFTFMGVIGSATAGKYLPSSQKVHWRAAGRLLYPDIPSPRRQV
jgi:hypothetical protein